MLIKLLNNRRLILVLLIAYTGLVCYLSLTRIQAPGGIQVWDKAAHACVYFGFAILSGLLANTRKQFFLMLLGWFGFGILIEILQGYTPYRSPSFLDQVANSVGLISGLLFVALCRGFLKRKQATD